MLFRRRNKQNSWARIRNLIWPDMGLKRLYSYYKHRSVRIPASEHSIAAGFAFGCAVSWTPTFGTHFLQCLIFCWVARASLISSFLGTAFGNPWTFPMLMLIAYHVGRALFVATGNVDIIEPAGGAESFGEFLRGLLSSDITWDWFRANFAEYFLPTLLGGYVMGLATFPLFYFPFYYMVKGARAARRARIERKVHAQAVSMTGQPE